MAHVLLSETDDWTLVNDDQDIRGRDLLDAAGLRIGQIRDMVVNTETEHVDEVILEDGTRHPAADLDIEGEAVYLRGAGTTEGRQPYRYEGVQRSDAVIGGTGPIISGTDTMAINTPDTISGAEVRDYMPAGDAAYDLDAYDSEYETHYGTEYGLSGNPYSFYRPAYRFGTEVSASEGLLGTSFEDIEPRLRERWASAFPGLRYDDYRGAVRYGFERRRS